MQLTGRAAIITGGSRGLGRAIARRFIREGADVMIAARDITALQEAVGELVASCANSSQRVHCQVADISDPHDVQRLVDVTIDTLGRVDILVCNAGVLGPIGRVEEVDWDRWAETIRINLLGTVLCCRAVLPVMRRQGTGRIIVLSGGGATAPRPQLSAYATSKAAVVRFAETLAEELRDTGITVNAVAPGALNTRMLEQILAAGEEIAGLANYQQAVRQQRRGGDSLDEAAGLVTLLASSRSDGITGRLLSAVWDNWRELPAHRERLAASDVYTLRRIVPADRGWELP
jgi:NAD(P)-dependent dehydrogenase (short-subunit alcohol dehydrogenase family)